MKGGRYLIRKVPSFDIRHSLFDIQYCILLLFRFVRIRSSYNAFKVTVLYVIQKMHFLDFVYVNVYSLPTF
jgi:hypothetical protein